MTQIKHDKVKDDSHFDFASRRICELTDDFSQHIEVAYGFAPSSVIVVESYDIELPIFNYSSKVDNPRKVSDQGFLRECFV